MASFHNDRTIYVYREYAERAHIKSTHTYTNTYTLQPLSSKEKEIESERICGRCNGNLQHFKFLSLCGSTIVDHTSSTKGVSSGSAQNFKYSIRSKTFNRVKTTSELHKLLCLCRSFSFGAVYVQTNKLLFD